MAQKFTSANTSINSSKLPAIYNKVDFKSLFFHMGRNLIDYGCGKFDNGKEYIESLDGNWFGYDPYNRTEAQNQIASDFVLHDDFDSIICSNVLNVIDDDETVKEIADAIVDADVPYFVTVYEGNGTGCGKQSKADCYQRNQKACEYLGYFKGAIIRHGVITNAPEFVK